MLQYNELIEISNRNLTKAFQIIEELRINEIWEELDSTCNLVGSVKTRLLMNHLDIDFHTYSRDFSIAKSFEAIAKISENPKIKEIIYKNLLEAEDMCLEWHLSYAENPSHIWTIDIIHIKNESPYVGMIERVTEKINAVLNENMRKKILEIKYASVLNNEKNSGIEIYQAVIDDKVETYEDFKAWQKNRSNVYISMWEPKI